MTFPHLLRSGHRHRDVAEGRTSVLSPYTEQWSWGRVDLPDPVRMTRSGIATYRLSVYAPGTSELERRELTRAKRWWTGSAASTLAAELVVAAAGLGESVASLAALAGCSVAWYWLARTRTIRRQTRSLRVAVVLVGSREVIGDAALFGECRRQLALVDDSTGAGKLSPVQREAIWASVYDRLAPRGATVQTADRLG